MVNIVMKLIIYSAPDGNDILTGIMQMTANSPHVGCFISDPFTLKNNVFTVSRNWDRVLLDIVLGVQLYRMRMSAQMILDISVFTDSKADFAQRKELQTVIGREERNGSSIRFCEWTTELDPAVRALYRVVRNQVHK